MKSWILQQIDNDQEEIRQRLNLSPLESRQVQKNVPFMKQLSQKIYDTLKYKKKTGK